MKWIPYVEIRDSATRKIVGLIEGAEIFFEYSWNGCGAFEIYCRATNEHLALLKQGRYVTLPNEIDYTDANGNQYCNIWRIMKIQRDNDRIGGRYLIASGKEAKCIVGNRIIREPATVLKTTADQFVDEVKNKLFIPNIINPTIYGDLGTYANRKIDEFVFADSTVKRTLEDETQVSWDNLLDYTEQLYATYNCGAKLRLNKNDLKLYYTIYEGEDKTSGNNRVVFSQANENLLSSDYEEDYENYKTYLLVGGEEKEDENGNKIGIRKVLSVEVAGEDGEYTKGVDRYEVFIDARDITSKYEEEIDGEKVEKQYTDEQYSQFLSARGYEKQASEYSIKQSFNGEIDTTNEKYQFNQNYYLGDLVKIRDNDYGNEVPVQIIKFTRVQNNEGYKEYFEHEVKEV